MRDAYVYRFRSPYEILFLDEDYKLIDNTLVSVLLMRFSTRRQLRSCGVWTKFPFSL